jgi:hypothetical protein
LVSIHKTAVPQAIKPHIFLQNNMHLVIGEWVEITVMSFTPQLLFWLFEFHMEIIEHNNSLFNLLTVRNK